VTQFDRFLTKVLHDPEARAAFDASQQRNKIIDTLMNARVAAGLSAREVSRRMGVSDATVRRLEQEGSDPTISLVQLYARAVGYRLQLDLKASNEK
jgi:ribosome-binding protein aMBF1 (putative translation factor)